MRMDKEERFTPIPRERALVVQTALVPRGGGKKRKKRHWVRRTVLALLALTLVAGFFALDVPNWQQLDENRLTNLSRTSRVYDREGTLITALRARENRTPVKLSALPSHVRDAFIAAEDLRFYQHNGFDLVRIFGAIVADVKSQSYSQGASTISQQLVKLTHLSHEKSIARKAEELYLSIQLETRFTKDEILEMYLNTVYFGEGAYGVQAAAEQYFGKNAADLTAAEGASLAAALKAPSAYAPGSEANRARTGYILETMVENGMLDEAPNAAVEVARAANTDGVHGWFVDAALDEAEAILGIGADDLLTGGYYIETTMDARLQSIAEELFADADRFPNDASDGTPVQGALAVVETKTGGLSALIGGREYAVRRGFNRATQMRRQPGSALKPLAVYAPALTLGYTAASVLLDERTDFGGGYIPRNSGNVYHGNVSVRRALALSMNVAAVRLMSEIGVWNSTAFLEKAGIPLDKNDGNLSLALGAMTTGVTPAELAASYALFGNAGVFNPAFTIRRIFSSDGTLLYEHEENPRTVLSPQNAYLMTSLLQSVTGWGTGAKLSATGLAVAGKTGTVSLVGRSGNRDIWMAAYTSDHSLAVWMGFDNTDAAHHLPSWQSGGDATAAMATAFYRAAYKDQPKPGFARPSGLISLTIDTRAGEATGTPMLAGAGTPDEYKLSELFLESNRPWQTSTIWQAPRAVSYFYIDYDASGYPNLVFGCTDSARYRIERIRNGATAWLTELYGDAGQTLSYVDYSVAAGEWYTYRVTPVTDTAEGPASAQSVQAKWAGGFFGGILRWVFNR